MGVLRCRWRHCVAVAPSGHPVIGSLADGLRRARRAAEQVELADRQRYGPAATRSAQVVASGATVQPGHQFETRSSTCTLLASNLRRRGIDGLICPGTSTLGCVTKHHSPAGISPPRPSQPWWSCRSRANHVDVRIHPVVDQALQRDLAGLVQHRIGFAGVNLVLEDGRSPDSTLM